MSVATRGYQTSYYKKLVPTRQNLRASPHKKLLTELDVNDLSSFLMTFSTQDLNLLFLLGCSRRVTGHQ
jgi:hypothetical protein